MNPVSSIIPQNPERLAQQQPGRLPGSFERTFTAITQLFCGFIAVICGLEFIILKPGISFDDQERYYVPDVYYKLERLGNTGFGIWGGLIFVATAIPYLFGRNKKFMVGLYFGFCLVSAVIAAVGIGLSVTAINGIVIYRGGEHCNGAKDTVDDCRYEARQMYVHHLIFYGILLAAVSVELFASLYGASAALAAFCSCKCCYGRHQTPCYTCSSYQSVVNHGCNNFTVSPPEPTTIDTTQIPQMSPPPYISPQGLLGRPQNAMYEIPNM